MLLDERAQRRMRSHLLSTSGQNIADAAAHMCAVQAQDFAAARWALGIRSADTAVLDQVDAAFDRGEIVRAWTMRGTIHALAARDLAWMLTITGSRQDRQAASTRSASGIDDQVLRRVEQVARRVLAGGGRLSRADMSAAFTAAGVDTTGQRGYHLLVALAIRGVIAQGPVIARPGGITREQYFVLAEEWISSAPTPADPLAEFFARFIAGHGPAGAADFAWWTGLPITVAREAATRAEALPDRVLRVTDDPAPEYIAASHAGIIPAVDAAALPSDTLALPAFDEYYLPYADRSALLRGGVTTSDVGPVNNGMVKGVIVTNGWIHGAWTPTGGIIGPLASEPDAMAAVARYDAFFSS